MASFRRRLTACSPSTAYEALRISQRNVGSRNTSSEHSSVVPATVNLETQSERVVTSWNEWTKHVGRGRNRSDSESADQARRHVRQNVNRSGGVEVSRHDATEVNRSGARGMEENNNRESTPIREQAEVPNAFDRLQFETLKKQVKEYKETVANLQKIQTRVLEKVAELPRHCKWECVAKVLTDVVSFLLIGSDVDCCMYPVDMELVTRILASFGIKMEQRDKVEQFLTKWGRGGQEGLMQRVYDNIRDMRGSILRVLRAEFYIQLGLPKPRDGEEEKIAEWKSQLASLRRTQEWRMTVDIDISDPWGTAVVHHSIARVLKGIRYNHVCPVTLSSDQAAFFLYNLELAIEGRVMEAPRMNVHHKGMHDMAERIKRSLKDMKQIIVLVK